MLRLASISLALASMVSAAGAGLITSEDDLVFGADSLTRDHTQGLDFLDVTLSLNRTFNDVSSQFGMGGDFAGFRYATEAEVVSLVNNFGFSPGAVVGIGVTGDTGADQLSPLVDLLGGPTLTGTGFRITEGITSTPTVLGQRYILLIDFTDADDQVASNSTINVDTARTFIGSFLVRESPGTAAVPEPSTISLALIASASGLACIRRRKRPAADRSAS